MTIRKSSSASTAPQRWRELYRDAVFGKRPHSFKRLSDAEEAIGARTRELAQQTGSEAEVERDAMDDALYALRALRIAEKNERAA